MVVDILVSRGFLFWGVGFCFAEREGGGGVGCPSWIR